MERYDAIIFRMIYPCTILAKRTAMQKGREFST